jgi:UDP-N-acetylmuramoyl-tripeptide--D-alanyl-D-alanine ligase
MNHPGEIRQLVDMVKPDIAIVTTVAAAHLGHLSDMQEIARAKAEITEGIAPGGHVLLNRDNEYFPILEAAAKRNGVEHIHTFGAHEMAEFRLLEFEGEAEYSVVKAQIGGEKLEFAIGAPGRHVAENALAVLATAKLAGADVERAAEALEDFKPEKGRGQRHKLDMGEGYFTLIDESYNANPASMRAAIELLAATPVAGDGRRIAVLGDMLEMGENASSEHAALAEPLGKAGIEHVWLAGSDMEALAQALGSETNLTYRATADELAAYTVGNLHAGDVLVVKSSLGTGFGKITAQLLEKFPPVEGR